MLSPISAPPHSISPEAHAELTSRTPASFSDIPPVLAWEGGAEIALAAASWPAWGGAARVAGRLYVTEE